MCSSDLPAVNDDPSADSGNATTDDYYYSPYSINASATGRRALQTQPGAPAAVGARSASRLGQPPPLQRRAGRPSTAINAADRLRALLQRLLLLLQTHQARDSRQPVRGLDVGSSGGAEVSH